MEIFVQLVLNVVVAIVLGGVFGISWAERQKRKELALGAVDEFRRAYGQFFGTWKLWEAALRRPETDAAEKRWELLEKAAEAEGALEALLVRVATERRLSDPDHEALGKLRQGFQYLRECIREGRSLGWRSSDDPHYIEVKSFATRASHILAESDGSKRPSADDARSALLAITSNRWERSLQSGNETRLKAPQEPSAG
jgi:hypothetical protein